MPDLAPLFDNYRQLPLLVAALLNKGISEEDTSRLSGWQLFTRIHESEPNGFPALTQPFI